MVNNQRRTILIALTVCALLACFGATAWRAVTLAIPARETRTVRRTPLPERDMGAWGVVSAGGAFLALIGANVTAWRWRVELLEAVADKRRLIAWGVGMAQRLGDAVPEWVKDEVRGL